jgi:hypothetical protein
MKLALDASQVSAAYGQAFQRFRTLSGFSQRDVLRAEAGVILKTWAGRTKVAGAEAIGVQVRKRISRSLGLSGRGRGDGTESVSINMGMRGVPGRVWWHTRNNKFQLAGQMSKNGQSFSPRNIHFRRLDWLDIKEATFGYSSEIRRALPMALRSAGLARQSVIQIADGLGIDLATVKGGGTLSAAGIAKARAAIASNGRAYRNGVGRMGGDETRDYIELINTLPYNAKIGMDRTLLGVLNGRAAFIETSYRKGAFNSLRNSARAFPNLFNTSGLN